ncbi:hypothetical protein GCM10020367_36270 [Streptomyces sannanensis]|uniref:DUF3558 domain-containing protein n=1 Tax=Streptomyces sannanensis TaxID=285536 RepID=A0ABP6SDC8_9ACTN
MQRRAYVSGLVLLATLVTGCSAGSGGSDSESGAKTNTVQPAAAPPPGKYRTLPEACGAVDRGLLKDMLPVSPDLPEEEREKVYAGTAALTYDTDRRVGCNWKAESPDATRRLVVDFERVVSYDAAMSDEGRAQEVYAKKQAAAGLPVTTSTSTPGDSQAPTAPPVTPPSGADSTTPPQPAEGLEPRVLDNLGDAAFLNDVPAGAGSVTQGRTVSVVFRTSNVIVTVQYTVQPALPTVVPDSGELQEKARALAGRLAEQFGE